MKTIIPHREGRGVCGGGGALYASRRSRSEAGSPLAQPIRGDEGWEEEVKASEEPGGDSRPPGGLYQTTPEETFLFSAVKCCRGVKDDIPRMSS